MAENIMSFHLAGARFSRIVIDEATIGAHADELNVSVQRQGPLVSEHKSGDRAVIEIGMRLTVTATGRAENIVDVECTAGFIGAAPQLDGDLEAFGPHADFYSRAVYWILRSRLQTLFATTRLQSAVLPWDMDSYNGEDSNVELSKKGTTKAASKRSATAKRVKALPKGKGG